MEFLFSDWLGTPAWFWLSFITLVIALTAFDLGVLNRKSKEIGVRASLALSAFYLAAGLVFGAYEVWKLVRRPAEQPPKPPASNPPPDQNA